jgi:hypothetical protein
LDDMVEATGDSFTYTFETETPGDYTITARAEDSKGAFSSNATLVFTLSEEAGPPFYCYFNVPYGVETYVIETCSNSSVADLVFSEDLLRIQFDVERADDDASFCNITIPMELLSGNFSVFMDDLELEEDVDYTVASNSTHSILGINYEHSAQEIDIIEVYGIPDFAGWLFLPFIVSATLVAFAFMKRVKKHRKPF